MLRVYVVEQNGVDVAVCSSAKKAVDYIRANNEVVVTTDDLYHPTILKVKKSETCNLTPTIVVKRFVMD